MGDERDAGGARRRRRSVLIPRHLNNGRPQEVHQAQVPLCNHKPSRCNTLFNGQQRNWKVAPGLKRYVLPRKKASSRLISWNTPRALKSSLSAKVHALTICKLQKRQCPARIRYITESCTLDSYVKTRPGLAAFKLSQESSVVAKFH